MSAATAKAKHVRKEQRELFTLLASRPRPSTDQEPRPLWPPYERLLAIANPQPGHRVLDLACGGGGPTIAIARRVGSEGSVLGLDLTPALLDDARDSAARQLMSNIEFQLIDDE